MNRSLRFLFDLQATQTTGSRNRGVGRYSQALFKTLLAQETDATLYSLLSQELPAPDIRFHNQAHVLRLPTLPHWGTDRDFSGGDQDSLDAIAYSSFAQTLKPDLIHVSHAFEDWVDRIPLPNLKLKSPGQVISATLYDLIPLRFQEHYFQNEEFKRWYLARTAWLRQTDLLLAISESTRQDAIELLDIEPSRVVTIHGGVDPHFKPLDDIPNIKAQLKKRYPLTERMVLYTGGDEYRKNLSGAIQGFAKIPATIRKNTTFFIVCSITDNHKKAYLKEAMNAGLEPDDIHFTGFIPEEDLVAFYNACDVFLFPSKYEGFGLPVLEAMSCGAAVIGSNNSSIREIIQREDALFDADNPESIADMLIKVLTDSSFRNTLKFYGRERSQSYSWEKTAELTRQAFKQALSVKQEAGIQAALNGWLPQKRLAMLTPLPPCRSGIADYNAQFLPYLAKHFEIDLYVDGYAVTDVNLTSAFRIYDISDFEKVAASYDAILYEMGNSDFHAHMVPLLMRFPGIVGLHDAYLSGLFFYMDTHLGTTNYIDELLTAHGPRARQYFAPIHFTEDAFEKSRSTLPCTKKILDHAVGIISHSSYNIKLAQQHYPEYWLAPYSAIPQMTVAREKPASERLITLRKKLGFKPDDFIISTFGHVSPTKCSMLLLDAFMQSKFSNDENVHLIFVGCLDEKDEGNRVFKEFFKKNSTDRIKITGFVTDENYQNYLHITDLAIQLRVNSRGGTPKGVLDCLGRQVPVIVNNDASYTDYPDDVVIKLHADPSVEELITTFDSIAADPCLLARSAKQGFEYAKKQHHPNYCAAMYAQTIHEFMERHKAHTVDYWAQAFAPYLASVTTKKVQSWLCELPKPMTKKPRLIIDVSYIAKKDHGTGIQRVVREIVNSLYCIDSTKINPIAVQLQEGELYIAKEWLTSQGILLHTETQSEKSQVIQFEPGDQLLMLDSSWERYSEFYGVFEQARQAHVPITTVVYDILPILLPQGNFISGGKEWFEAWLNDAIEQSDNLVCISQSVANDVIDYLEQHNINKPLNIGFWHLGADFDADKKVIKDPTNTLPKPYLLMVGTIEPRKSHDIALDLMEKLWQEGIELNLYIAGNQGWLAKEIMKKIKAHPLLNKKLFFNESLDDSQIANLYASAAGLLFLSKGEGFGLPLVEAANHGIPILCTDLPAFKEIAGEYATYVCIENRHLLLEQTRDWWNNLNAGKLPNTSNMPRLTWKESARKLLDSIPPTDRTQSCNMSY